MRAVNATTLRLAKREDAYALEALLQGLGLEARARYYVYWRVEVPPQQFQQAKQAYEAWKEKRWKVPKTGTH